MRKALLVLGLLLIFAAGAAAGYLYGTRGQSKSDAQAQAQATGAYQDTEILAIRDKLPKLPLPISKDQAFVLLGIDESRLGREEFSGWGNGGNQSQTFTWRLSPTYGIALYSEFGPDFGPHPPSDRPVTRIAIGKCIPAPGTHPEAKLVVLDKDDKEKTEHRLPQPGKGSHWAEWQYPNITKTTLSFKDDTNSTGGFACTTTDDYDKVLEFYYDKCGVAKGTMQSSQGGEGTFTTFRNYESNPMVSAFRARCLCLKKPGYTVNIAVVQPQDKKETQIFVNLW
jgi:hypothetical protein